MKMYIADPVLSTIVKLGYIKVPAEQLIEILTARSTDSRSKVFKEKIAEIDKFTMSDGSVVLCGNGSNDFEIGEPGTKGKTK